jgi:hypothetical protein
MPAVNAGIFLFVHLRVLDRKSSVQYYTLQTMNDYCIH